MFSLQGIFGIPTFGDSAEQPARSCGLGGIRVISDGARAEHKHSAEHQEEWEPGECVYQTHNPGAAAPPVAMVTALV